MGRHHGWGRLWKWAADKLGLDDHLKKQLVKINSYLRFLTKLFLCRAEFYDFCIGGRIHCSFKCAKFKHRPVGRAGDLRFKPPAGQIEHIVTNGLLPMQYIFRKKLFYLVVFYRSVPFTSNNILTKCTFTIYYFFLINSSNYRLKWRGNRHLNDAEMGPAISFHASAYYSKYDKRFPKLLMWCHMWCPCLVMLAQCGWAKWSARVILVENTLSGDLVVRL